MDQLARRLDTALTDLEIANQALRGEVERERELDRQRMAFFNAASHELKTPVTILKGQLSGMLEGVGVYQDRDKYLLRSLQVTGRMENLVREMLAISQMETGSVAIKQEPVDLSALIEQQLTLDAGLLEQREQRLVSTLTLGSPSPAIHLFLVRLWGTCSPTQPSTHPMAPRSACGVGCEKDARL